MKTLFQFTRSLIERAFLQFMINYLTSFHNKMPPWIYSSLFSGRLFRNGRGTWRRWCWLLSGGVQSWWVWQEQTKLDRDYPGIHIHSYCCAHIHIVSWNILFQFQAQVKLQSFVIKDLNWQGVPQKTWIWELE